MVFKQHRILVQLLGCLFMHMSIWDFKRVTLQVINGFSSFIASVVTIIPLLFPTLFGKRGIFTRSPLLRVFDHFSFHFSVPPSLHTRSTLKTARLNNLTHDPKRNPQLVYVRGKKCYSPSLTHIFFSISGIYHIDTIFYSMGGIYRTLTFGDVIGPKKITEISSLSVK